MECTIKRMGFQIQRMVLVKKRIVWTIPQKSTNNLNYRFPLFVRFYCCYIVQSLMYWINCDKRKKINKIQSQSQSICNLIQFSVAFLIVQEVLISSKCSLAYFRTGIFISRAASRFSPAALVMYSSICASIMAFGSFPILKSHQLIFFFESRKVQLTRCDKVHFQWISMTPFHMRIFLYYLPRVFQDQIHSMYHESSQCTFHNHRSNQTFKNNKKIIQIFKKLHLGILTAQVNAMQLANRITNEFVFILNDDSYRTVRILPRNWQVFKY